MKKLTFSFLTLGLICFLHSCKETAYKNTAESQAEKNIVKLHLLYKGIETGDNSMLDTMLVKDYIDHVPGHNVVGIADLKKYLSQLRNGITSLKIKVLAEASSDTCIFSKIELTGVTKVPMNGMPSNMKMDMIIVDVIRVSEGKFMERWAFIDPNSLLKK